MQKSIKERVNACIILCADIDQKNKSIINTFNTIKLNDEGKANFYLVII